MKYSKIHTCIQSSSLVILRLLIGWHIFYEGIAKLLKPGWSSASFLKESKWIFSDLFSWIVSHSEVLKIVDFLNVWGLILIGAGLILGLFIRFASLSGVVLLLLYYSAVPPLIGLEYSVPMEGDYLVINKTLIEAASLLVVFAFPAYSFSIDSLIFKNKVKDIRS